jgi:hypothetical protein
MRIAAKMLSAMFIGCLVGVSATAQSAPSTVPYTLALKAERRDLNGTATAVFTEIVFHAGDGRTHSIRRYSKDTSFETFSVPGTGLLVLDEPNHRLLLKSSYTQTPKISEGAGNIGESADILGYKVERVHLVRGRTNIDLYRAPKLDGIVLRSVVSNDHGTFITEAQSITVGEPPSTALEMPPLRVEVSTASSVNSLIKRGGGKAR